MADAYDLFDTSLSALFSVPPIAYSTSSPDEAHVYTPPTPTAGATAPAGAHANDNNNDCYPASRPVKLWLPHPPADLYTTLQANNLWLSAVFLADSIARGDMALAKGSTLAELGAGAGLPSIMAWRAGVNVVCTDYDSESVIKTLNGNFEVEAAAAGQATVPTASQGHAASDVVPSWHVLGHTWGTSPAPLLAHAPAGFDAVILADTLWSSDKHGVLLDSVCALLRRPSTTSAASAPSGASGLDGAGLESKAQGSADGASDTVKGPNANAANAATDPHAEVQGAAQANTTSDSPASCAGVSGADAGGVVHVAAGLHTGRGPFIRFLDLARARGLEPSFEREVCWRPGGGWAPHAYDGSSTGEERGVVVYYTLRWA